jgi:hypothetical protein
VSSDSWAVFAVAWPVERAARMDASLARVRDWLVADGVVGLGTGNAERVAARQRAQAAGLTSQEGWLVRDALVADARRLMPPGGRVQERAKRVTAAVTGALAAQRGLRPRPVAPRGSVGVLGRPEVTRYAVEGHVWQPEDPVLVVEDLPWSVTDDWRSMRALPVVWLGIVADPPTVGLRGDSWREAFWKFGDPRPVWAGDPAARARVFAFARAFGWNGMPLRADLDDVERFLPTARLAPGKGEHVAWLVPGVSGTGWALAWPM